MKLPVHLTIYDSAYALDGGTTYFRATDEGGQEHSVLLVQHAFPASLSLAPIPGRLYFDDQLVPMRSEFEAGVLALLRSATFRHDAAPSTSGERLEFSPHVLILGNDIREVLTGNPVDVLRAQTSRVIEFVASDDYLRFAERMEQAADETRYDVWVAWDAGSRNRVVVRLAAFLGVGLSAAAELVKQDRPFAEGVSALQVADLAARYRAAGLGVRVDPAYRWQLP